MYVWFISVYLYMWVPLVFVTCLVFSTRRCLFQPDSSLSRFENQGYRRKGLNGPVIIPRFARHTQLDRACIRQMECLPQHKYWLCAEFV